VNCDDYTKATDGNPECSTDCCKAKKAKCGAMKAMTLFATFGAFVSLIGIAKPTIGIVGGVLCFFGNLAAFSITASLINGKPTDDNGQVNDNADCGFASTSVQGLDTTTTGGAAFGLAIVSCLIALVQIFLYHTAARNGAYGAL